MPQIKGHKKPITNAANVGSTKIGHHFLICFSYHELAVTPLLFPSTWRRRLQVNSACLLSIICCYLSTIIQKVLSLLPIRQRMQIQRHPRNLLPAAYAVRAVPRPFFHSSEGIVVKFHDTGVMTSCCILSILFYKYVCRIPAAVLNGIVNPMSSDIDLCS